jgi:pimeloyl-ACP methyl ester carboxylesterase
MARLAFGRSGAGAPLVLLHALGLSRHTWDPVVPALAELFDVIAVDLPGFGGSEPLPDGVEPSPAALAGAVAELLDELGVTAPHLAGNSLGGWVALELAGIRPVASLTLAPVTVAFGSRDLVLLPRQSRHLDQLPPGTCLETLPAGGHVPMTDNPGAVTALILHSTAREGGGCDSRCLWG